jgi:hypothetical protein
MTDLENGRAHGEWTGPPVAFSMSLVTRLVCLAVWLLGMASTLYLVIQAFLILFFVVGFINHATPDLTGEKLADVMLSAVPLCCFAAIGIVGLRSWPWGRFRLWGQYASVIQTAAAVFLYTSPEGIEIFFDLLRWARS